MAACNPLKMREIVGNGHGQGEELFEGLAGLVEIHRNPAAFQTHAVGEIFELLDGDFGRGLHQQLGPFDAFLAQAGQDFGELMAPAPFVVGVLASGEAAQVGDQDMAIGQAVGADVVGDARSHDLLGAAASDAEQKLEGSPIDERAGKSLNLPDDVVDFAIPGRFCRHGIHYVSAHLRKMQKDKKEDRL
jgi:hypothetical protein